MKKIMFLIAIGCVLIGCNEKVIENEVYKSETLIINQISKHTYLHISYMEIEPFGRFSGNGMIVVNKNEAIVFDTPGDDKTSAELIDFINNTLKFKIIAVIPTHYHLDNLGGLAEFHRRGIPSYAFYETIRLAKENDYPIPQHGFENYLELKVGNETVIAKFFGEGHTIDNIIGYFPLEDIMFGGCLIKEIGSGQGNIAEANIEMWSETVRKIKAKYPNVQKVIPGHGKIGGIELLDYTINLYLS